MSGTRLLLTGMAAAHCAWALDAADIKPIPCETFTLANGVRCVVAEKHDTSIVAIQVYVDAGLIHERESAGNGISHYIEHMASEPMNPLGNTANAYTTVDHVCYYCNVVRERWVEALGLAAACVTNCQFPASLLAREKGVIAQEIRMGNEDPDEVLGCLMDETIHTRGPMRAPIAGWLDSFTNTSSADVAAYYRRQYTANNMIVSVAGDVTAAEARQAITRVFSTVVRGPAEAVTVPAEPQPLGPRTVSRRFNVNEARVELSFPGVRQGDKDMYALDLLAAVLSDGDMSILVKRLKDELQLVYSISAGAWSPYFCPGTFTVDLECDETNVAAAIRHTLATLERVKEAPVDPARLDRAKRAMLVGRLRDLQDVETVAASLADGIMLCCDPNYTAHYLHGMLATTTNDLLRAARTWLDTNVMTTASLLPEQEDETTCVSAVAAPVTHTADVVRLPNGVRLALMPVADARLVAFSAWLPGGLAFETPVNNGISTFAAATMTKGTTQLDADAFALALESLGASVGVSAGREGIEASAEYLPADATAVAKLLAGAVLDPVFAPAEIEKQRRVQLGDIRTRCDDWGSEANLYFHRALFGAHPYSMPQDGESNVVARFSHDDLVAFHRRIIQPSNIVVAAAGAFDPAALRALLEQLFGGATASAPPLPVCAVWTPPTTNTTHIVPVPRAQATVLVGYPNPTIMDDARHAASVATWSLDGFEGSLFVALRGKTNLTYIAGSGDIVDTHAGVLSCIAQCEPGAVPCVIAIMTNIVAELARTPLTSQRLDRVKSDILTGLSEQRQRLRSMVSVAALCEYRGLGANALLDLPDKTRAITSAAVRDVAASNFTAWTCIVTMPEEK